MGLTDEHTRTVNGSDMMEMVLSTLSSLQSTSSSCRASSPLARCHGPETPDELYGSSFNSSVITRVPSYRAIKTAEVEHFREGRSDRPDTYLVSTRTASDQQEIDEPERVMGWGHFAEPPPAPVEVAEEERGCGRRDGDGSGGNESEELVAALKERVAALEIAAAATEREADIQAAKKKELRTRVIALQGELAATKRSAARQEKVIVATVHAITVVTESFRDAPLTPSLLKRVACFGEEVAQTLEKTRNLGVISTE